MKLWAKAFLGIFLSILFVCVVFAGEEDVEGNKDHPLIYKTVMEFNT